MTDLNVVTLATFLYLAHRAGHALHHDGLRAACAAIDADGANAETGGALVAALSPLLDSESPEKSVESLRQLLGDAWQTGLGAGSNREERTAALRRARFGRSTPWLAWLLERSAEGKLHHQVVMVEGFGDEVLVMDPNPFNDIDEARSYPVVEFMTRWELAGAWAVGL